MISVVISTNNTQGRYFVKKNLEVLLDTPIVDDIHICHHNFHQYFRIDHERIYEWTCWDQNLKGGLGLATRLEIALEVKHKCILLVDDDIELNSDIINRLYKEHKENSLRVIGTEGVKLNPLIKEVKPYDFQEDYVDVVYGRVIMIPKQLVDLFWKNESVLDSYKDKSIPPWNGFDILLSAISTSEYGFGNYVINPKQGKYYLDKPLNKVYGQVRFRNRIVNFLRHHFDIWETDEEPLY
tara:strand:+ start:939 stop:1655 length:717 start_codon:yes stop_codon:yes gene_type:complete